MAFIAGTTAEGTVPARLIMTASSDVLMSNSSDSVNIRCLLKDAAGRFCGQAANEITFQKTGPGILLGQNPVQATAGLANIIVKADTVVGQSRIIASSPGLTADTVAISISNRLIIDNFENYSLNSALLNNWKVRSGTTGELTLEQSIRAEGMQSMKYHYAIGEPNETYGTIIRSFRGDYGETIGFACWIKGDGSNRALQIRVRDTTGRYCYYDLTLGTTDWQYLDLFYADLAMSDTVDFNPAKFMEIWFTVRAGSGTDGEGTIYLDGITLKVPGFDPSTIYEQPSIPLNFQLYQNYPNPFNSTTTFRYTLSESSTVRLSLYSITGQKVTDLINRRQNAGEYIVHWDAAGLASGLYLYSLETDEYRFVRKCVLIK